MKKINDISGIDLNRLSFYFKNNNRDFISVYINDKNRNYNIYTSGKGSYIKYKGIRYYINNFYTSYRNYN